MLTFCLPISKFIMRKIIIIGGGFTGTMTAVHLIQKATDAFQLTIINQKETFTKGFAFNPYSKKHLLNVMTSRMSAFKIDLNHFLAWVMQHTAYCDKERSLIGNSFLPRYIYGEYLEHIWQYTLNHRKNRNIELRIVDDVATNLHACHDQIIVTTSCGEKIYGHFGVIATGNQLPGNPKIKNTAFFNSKNYQQNPWRIDAVSTIKNHKPVLIIGNGLTMVDSVIGLHENGFRSEIYSLSPNGFNILPHRHNGMVYTKLTDELPDHPNLYEIVRLFNKHIKLLREFGISPEPLIDSMRVHTQQIWQGLSIEEKRKFMSRLRHLWGVARHRIPSHIHDWLRQLQIDQKLHIVSGKLLDIEESEGGIQVSYYDKKQKEFKNLEVSRVINCTGPETNLMRIEDNFLKGCFLDGLVTQDELKLGLLTDPKSFEIINKKGERQHNLMTLGSNLKGVLWESTAVNELRVQAEVLANQLLEKIAVTIDSTKEKSLNIIAPELI